MPPSENAPPPEVPPPGRRSSEVPRPETPSSASSGAWSSDAPPSKSPSPTGPAPAPPPASWQIYSGSRTPHDGITRLPAPPPWRTFKGGPPLPTPPGDSGNQHAAVSYRPSADAVRQVNAALYLRRPLLVTGAPGTGKSSLAYAVAHELGLGKVLHWPITSRVTLRDGLYAYDPLTRLYAAERARHDGTRGDASQGCAGQGPAGDGPVGDDIGDYLRLGPLGTALLPFARPRVLLVDEIDKSDIDLPNDLLTIFEKGSYELVELARRAAPTARVMTADSTKDRVEIRDGTVTCRAFPLVVMTSNGEREFPPAFLRRCVTVDLKQPATLDELTAIVREHLGPVVGDGTGVLPVGVQDVIQRFFDRRSGGLLANDQLLNAIYMCHHAAFTEPPESVARLADQVMPFLTAEAARSDDA
ncbi:AAA family ATPase [Streptomyces flavofungini]|uniref:AAA family ATPase n=1 Tax=Streptomyces flavofungini TaxID=68200 RepID=A0ABS0X5M9_9ACTN|nr:MoxR family ATPase [Streptomyces flavofungini]MBJ3808339.1 AAA family ATPase [Streptomyces flavofungini]GHC57998.1 ATPase AAA [Streptomyces flavofungini]